MNDEPRQPMPLSPMSSLRWWRMTLKELREILRDRRTIITLIGMPLLIYPLLGVTLQKVLVSQITAKAKVEYTIAFGNRRESRIVRDLFLRHESVQSARWKGQKSESQQAVGTHENPAWNYFEPKDDATSVDVDRLVADRVADVGIRIKEGPDEGPWSFLISYRDSSFGLDARHAIEDRLTAINDELTLAYLRDHDPAFVSPLTLNSHVIADGEAGPAFSMATLIPLILILMTVTGAVYPAIDLTAGERERGTLEALISAPVPRHELLFAKYLAVLAVAMLTALANLTSMVTTAYANGMEQLLFGSAGINLRMLALMLGLLFVFAGFFAAVILILTSFARSFKEAQAYLIPVMLVSMAPGVFCLLPGIEMTGWMSVTPLVNIVILARDVVDGRAQPVWAVAALMSTVLYSAVALALAAKIFGTDAVLYGSEGSWSDLFRRPSVPQSSATLSQSMTCLAVLFPAFLILSGFPRRFAGEDVGVWVVGNALLTILLFAVFPMVFARWCALDLRQGFRLQPATPISFIAALILGISLWPYAIELARMMSSSFENSDLIKEQFERISASLNALPLVAKLIALAVIPAVCEELFFRGYLLTSFRSGMSAPLAIALSGCLFGLFHVIPMLAFERLVPTWFLGMILGWVCVRTGSVLPGMLLHATHNSLILSMQTYSKELEAWGIGAESDKQVPLVWLAGAGIAVAVSMSLIQLATSRTKPEVADS